MPTLRNGCGRQNWTRWRWPQRSLSGSGGAPTWDGPARSCTVRETFRYSVPVPGMWLSKRRATKRDLWVDLSSLQVNPTKGTLKKHIYIYIHIFIHIHIYIYIQMAVDQNRITPKWFALANGNHQNLWSNSCAERPGEIFDHGLGRGEPPAGLLCVHLSQNRGTLKLVDFLLVVLLVFLLVFHWFPFWFS